MQQTHKIETNLHDGQIDVVQRMAKFSVIPCARRFGKTELIFWYVHLLVTRHQMWGIFSKEDKDVPELWNRITETYERIIKKVNTQKRIIYFKGGARLDFWSINNIAKVGAGRGRKYHKVIYEEAQNINGDILRQHFNGTILPMLADFDGNVIFFFTANGKNSYLFELAKKGAVAGGHHNDPDFAGLELAYDPNWIFIRKPTTDNPFIKKEVVDMLLAQCDTLTGLQEFYSVFVDYGGKIWCYTLAEADIQKKTFDSSAKVDFSQPLYLSFDFNKEPMTAICGQIKQTSRAEWSQDIKIVKEFRTPKDEKCSIYDSCQLIKEWIYKNTGRKIGRWYNGTNPDGSPRLAAVHPCTFPIMITGDASGDTADGRQQQPQTYYQIIKSELCLSDAAFSVPSHNPPHAESYIHVNTLLERHPSFKVNDIECPDLRVDMLNVKSNPDKTIDKKNASLTHLLDCFRYFVDTFVNKPTYQ